MKFVSRVKALSLAALRLYRRIMTEEATSTDVTEQEAVAPVESADESSSASQETSAPVKEKIPKEENFRRFEEKLRILERQNQELNETLNKREAPEPIDDSLSELDDLQDDDLITVGQMNKLAAKQAKKIVQEELDRKAKEELPNKVKKQFTDYDDVVTNENLEQLIKEDPDLEYDIKVAKNPYARAYKSIKASSFYKTKVTGQQDQKKIDENASKPVSSNTLGKSGALSQANAFATYSNDDLLSEMQAYRGGSL